MAPQLTTTSYALLTLLSLRSWTTYELAKQMQRNYHWFWPRAESKLYQEPKKLVALGLAQVEPGAGGRGKGTVYTITPEGRDALADWVRVPQRSQPRLEFETMVQLYAADHGTEESLLETIRTIREGLLQGEHYAAAIGSEMSDRGRQPFPQRVHINSLVHQFLWDVTHAMYRWTFWAEAEVKTWGDMSSTEKMERAREIFLLPSAILAERARDAEIDDDGG